MITRPDPMGNDYTSAVEHLLVIGFVVGGIAGGVGAHRYWRASRLFSQRWPCLVNVGQLEFELRYVYALRGPSGRIRLVWSDADQIYTQTDPRVLVRETWRSQIARIFSNGPTTTENDFATAVQNHLGDGWLVVTEIEAVRLPILRSIGHCIVHFRVRGEEKT